MVSELGRLRETVSVAVVFVCEGVISITSDPRGSRVGREDIWSEPAFRDDGAGGFRIGLFENSAHRMLENAAHRIHQLRVYLKMDK